MVWVCVSAIVNQDVSQRRDRSVCMWADGCQTGCRGAAAVAGGKDRCPPIHAAREPLLVGATRTVTCFGARYNVYSRLAAATEGLRAASLLRFSICDCSGAARTLGRLQP